MDLIILTLILTAAAAALIDNKSPSRAYANRGIFKGTLVFVFYEAPKTVIKAITTKMKRKTMADALAQSEAQSSELPYPVTLQQLPDGAWMAITTALPGCVASAPDPNEAVAKVRVIQEDAAKLGLAKTEQPAQAAAPDNGGRYPCGCTEPPLYFDASELVLASDTDEQAIFACETCVAEEGLTVVGPSLAKALGTQDALAIKSKVIVN